MALSDLDSIIDECLPSGWSLTHLIHLDPDWQVNLCDGEHVVVATGTTPGRAMASAYAKSFDPTQHIGRLIDLSHAEPSRPKLSLSEMLGLTRKPSEPVNRRF